MVCILCSSVRVFHITPHKKIFSSQHPLNFMFQYFWKILDPVKAISMYRESQTAFMSEVFTKFSQGFKAFSSDSHENMIFNPHHKCYPSWQLRNGTCCNFGCIRTDSTKNTPLLKLICHLLSSLSSYCLNIWFSALLYLPYFHISNPYHYYYFTWNINTKLKKSTKSLNTETHTLQCVAKQWLWNGTNTYTTISFSSQNAPPSRKNPLKWVLLVWNYENFTVTSHCFSQC
jgi:hypothetical protein